MTPFYSAALPPEAFDVKSLMQRMKCDEATAEKLVEFNKEQTVYMNDLYQVNVRNADRYVEGPEAIWWLSIKRLDKQPIHDWRDLQQIKNMIVGPEHEGFEIYPAESRLTDTANQYHLWVFKDSQVRIPVGFYDGRNVNDSDDAAAVGATQRKLNP